MPKAEKTYTVQKSCMVDAGNISVVDLGAFSLGRDSDISVPPGRYRVRMKANCWNPVDSEKLLDAPSGKLYIGDCCYLHSDKYEQMCDGLFGKPLQGFVGFDTGGDGCFDAEVSITPA